MSSIVRHCNPYRPKRVEASAVEHWYAVYTQPKRESLVCRELEGLGLEVYFPVLQFDRGYHRGVRLEPFFPNYLFVKVDLTAKNAANLRWMPGLRNIVGGGDEPAVLPDSVIASLHLRLDRAMKRDLRKGDRLFHAGQKVTVVEGPFKGFEAVFERGLNGEQRVQILLETISSSIRANVSVDQLARPARNPL